MSEREPGKCWCGATALPGAPLCKKHDDEVFGGLSGIADMVAKKSKRR